MTTFNALPVLVFVLGFLMSYLTIAISVSLLYRVATHLRLRYLLAVLPGPLLIASVSGTARAETVAEAPVLVPMTSPAVSTPAAPTATTSATTYRVQVGDSFWRIAKQRLAAASMAEINNEMIRLIALNQDRLRDPTNPSRIYPGQEFITD